MKKVLFVATVVKTHIMEFHIPYLKMLKEMGWETAVAAKNDYDNPSDCDIPYCDNYYDINFSRSPFSKDNIGAYKQLKTLIDEGNYDVVHCHTPVGGALARLAAKSARKNGTKVFYTAHGFHFFKGAPIKNWLIYYPVERYLSRLTDVLFTINSEDYKRAQTFHAKKVVAIPGIGIDTAKFRNTVVDKSAKRAELGIPEDAFLVLSVGELNKNKNHEVVIRAIAELNNDNIYYIIAGQGELKEYLQGLIDNLKLSKNVKLLGYRNDVNKLCHIADIFAFPSIREGLGIAGLEAMCAGLPMVTSNSNGINEYMMDGITGYLCDPYSIKLFAQSIDCLLSNEKFRKNMGQDNMKIADNFDIKYSIESTIKEYTD